jgi:hypothetical protein
MGTVRRFANGELGARKLQDSERFYPTCEGEDWSHTTGTHANFEGEDWSHTTGNPPTNANCSGDKDSAGFIDT